MIYSCIKKPKSLSCSGLLCAVILTGLSFFGTALSAAGERSRPSAHDLYLSLAEGSYAVADLKGAETALERVFRENPENLRGRALAARIALARNDPGPARNLIADLSTASDQDRDTVNAINRLREDLAAHSELGQVLSEPSAQVRSDAADFSTRQSRRERETKAVAQRLDALLPRLPDEHPLARDVTLTRARLQVQLGLGAEAADSLKGLLAKNPDDLEAVVLLASHHLDNAEWDELDILIAPLKSSPELIDIALYIEGRLAYQRKRIGQARARFEAALALQHTGADRLRPSLLFYRGLALYRLGRTNEAWESIESAIDEGFTAETIEEQRFAGRIALLKGEIPRAIYLLENAQRAPNADGAETAATIWLARAYYAAGLNPLALEALDQAINASAIPPSELLVLRGSVHRRLGDLNSARQDFAAALDAGDDNPATLFAAGLADFEAGAIEDARPRLAAASRKIRDNTTLHYLSALTHYLTEDSAETLQALSQLSPENHLGIEVSLLTFFATVQANPEARERALAAARSAIAEHPEARPGDRYDFILRALRGELTYERAIFLAAGDQQRRERISTVRCKVAFWLAQDAALKGEVEAQRSLLERALQEGHPALAEFQAARWQLGKLGE